MFIARRVADWPSSRVEDLIAAGHEHEEAEREQGPAVIAAVPDTGQVPVATSA